MNPPRLSDVDPEGEMISVPELARRLGCSRSRAYQLVELGHVLAFRFGQRNCLRVPASEAERLRQESAEGEGVGAGPATPA